MEFAVDPMLVERARSDAGALDELLEAVWPEVYRVALGVIRDSHAAQDSAQDACAAIARSLHTLRNAEVFYAWMYRIAGRCAVATAKRRSAAEDLPRTLVARCIDVDQRIDIESALERLPLTQRATIVLHYYAGLSSTEIGSALAMSAATVRFHLMLARRALRAMLDVRASHEKETCPDVR